MANTFDIIILIGRPASGKSEIIDYLLKLPDDEREQRFHLGKLGFIDDFPMLWTWFEEDHILAEQFGQPRLHTDADGYFKHEYLWHLLIERIDLEYRKLLRDNPDYYADHTTIVEFARGTEHGGYAAAFPHLSDELLRQRGHRLRQRLVRGVVAQEPATLQPGPARQHPGTWPARRQAGAALPRR